MNLITFFNEDSQEKIKDLGLLLLRVSFGASMLFGHGLGKMAKLFSEDPIKFADPFGFGPGATLALVVLAEVLCAILLILGLFTRAAAIPLIITMAGALIIVHWSDPFVRQEKAILFGMTFLFLLLNGAGRYSLDQLIYKKT